MNRVTNDYGKHLFLRFEDVINSNESYKSQITSIRRILTSLFRKLTQDEYPLKENLYNYQQCIFEKYRFEGKITDKSHRLRKLCNKCVHDEHEDKITKETIIYNPTSEDYKNAISDLSEIISHFSNYEITNSIKKKLIQEEEKPKKNSKQLRKEDLFNNPDPRIPVVMVLDTSSSMLIKDNGKDSRIDILNDGIRQFFKDVIEDERTRDSVEVCIITFDESIESISDFDKAENQRIYNLKARGGETLMNQGVEKGIQLLEERKKEYRDSGVEYFQPWLVLMTDGIPTESIKNSSKLTSQLATKNKLTIFPVGISQGADLTILNKFSPLRPALRLKDYHFKEFFEWLHKSVTKLSESTPGVEEKFSFPKPKTNWFES